jgi:hypothetical protein
MTEKPRDERYRLSKSKIAAFEHCPKRLWLQVHARHLSKFDGETLRRFQFGHDVGRLARFRVRNGVLMETGSDMQAALQLTTKLIAGSNPAGLTTSLEHAEKLENRPSTVSRAWRLHTPSTRRRMASF